MSKNVSFLNLHKDIIVKDSLIKSLCDGFNNEEDSNKFKEIVNYVINFKYSLFDRDEFKGTLYEGEDEILDLILPSIKRVYGKIFIFPPTLLKEKRLELLQTYFDIDSFIDYLIDMFIKSKNMLKIFDKIDRTAETLSLIVDNYVAGLVDKVRECKDHIKEIRDIKIDKITKN